MADKVSDVKIVAEVPGVGYVLDVEDVDFIALVVRSLSCDELARMHDVLPSSHKPLLQAAMRERGCPVLR
jgi:hypothetical protein